MTGLLVLAGLLLVVSGALKARLAGRAGLGFPLLPLAELITGAALMLISFARPLSPDAGLRLVVGSLVLLMVSTVRQGMVLGRAREERRASEGARLVTFVKYLSKSDAE